MKEDFYGKFMSAGPEAESHENNTFEIWSALWPELIHAAQNGGIEESGFHPRTEESNEPSEPSET